MGIYLVTYDLKKPGQHHAAVLAEVKKCPGWAKLSESSYVVSTSETPTVLLNRVRNVADTNDTIYVITVRRPHSGFGPPSVNEWLEKNLPH